MVEPNKKHPLATLKRECQCDTDRLKEQFYVSVSLFSVGQTPPCTGTFTCRFLSVVIQRPPTPSRVMMSCLWGSSWPLEAGSSSALYSLTGRENKFLWAQQKMCKIQYECIATPFSGTLRFSVISAKNGWKLWIYYFIYTLSISYTLLRIIFYYSSEVTIQRNILFIFIFIIL